MMSPYLAKLKQLSHRRKMHNLSLSLGQHLSQLERLDRELALARQQEKEFYRKFEIENDLEEGEAEPEVEAEAEEEEVEVEVEEAAEEEIEMEALSSDTFSSNSSKTSSSSSSSSSSTRTSSSGDQQGQGHGPGIGFDHLQLDQAQVQVHCADDPAPEESGDCLAIKEPTIKRLTNEIKEVKQSLLTEVPSPLEWKDFNFPMPSAEAIRLASKSKLNADAVAYKMPETASTTSSPFRLNVKAPIFKPSKESQAECSEDLPLSGTIAAAAAGAEATYQLLMRQMTMLHQPPDPLAHIHPLRPYPRPQRHQHPHQHQKQHPHHSHAHHLLPPVRALLPTPDIQPHVPVHMHTHNHSNQRGVSQSLLGVPPQLPEQLMHRIGNNRQHLRNRKEPLPDLFPEVLTLMEELLRPVSYPEMVTILAARLHRPVVELKRHIPHTLHAAVIHGYMSKEGNRYSLLSEAEHMVIKRRNHEAAQRAKELEKEPLSWRKR
ncbi:uncharacterized abhydrolase domain-containing protein DDB_G0269086 [Drosophila kikkawai]|uniref:Uncharacterized abhydrolase domain-containing protein DDB_G0269086 n=1 Tax=Drosophila kikkawai TaxID=30033 RepID=A0ABM3C5A0_DROKI|nr:uncharacterized protein LOC108080228 [Drosophila kikkawai]